MAFVLPYFFPRLPYLARSEVCSPYVVLPHAKRVIYLFSPAYQAAISNMDGVGGKPGWAWIFILEGSATVIASAASFFIIQDFPDNASFLSEAEREMVIRRLQCDDQFSAGGEKFKLQNIISSFKDWKTWLGSMLGASATSSNALLVLTRPTTLVGMFVGCDMPLYAFALFLPSIIHEVCLFLPSVRNRISLSFVSFSLVSLLLR